MNARSNISLALFGGMLLGVPWSVTPFFFLIFIAWVPLLMLEERLRVHSNPYAVFNYALLSFLVWNTIATWWVARAQLAGGIAIIAANALLQGLIFWSAERLRATLKTPFFIPFALIWMGYEYFHLSWDLAWPWLNLGNALATVPVLIQWYEVTGVRGGTFWILLVNFALFSALTAYRRRNWTASMPPAAAAVVLLTVPVLISIQLFHTVGTGSETVSVAVVQPNLDPYTEKFEPENYAGHMEAFYRTANDICDEDTRYLFGPETLIVEQIDEKAPHSSKYYRRLLEFHQKYPRMNILIGVHSFNRLDGDEVPPGSRFDREGGFYYEAFNTALFLSPGAAPQFYHKTKLVPLFERMPFVQHLRFLGRYSLELGGYTGTYSRRQENTVFDVSGGEVKIVPIVCFESIFGPYCARNLPPEKGFIAMVTNDGWWKNTPGYRHHFNFSPMRAIENRRDMVRVANTGISALIDARGVVVARTPWWEKATLKGTVHLRGGQTFFARHGDYLGRYSLGSAVVLIFCAAIGKWGRFPRPRPGQRFFLERKSARRTGSGRR